MTVGWGLFGSTLALAVLWTSCGLETVENVPKPVVVGYRLQPGIQDLVFDHDPNAYQGLNFQGYDLYYKVYPFDASFQYLSSDVQSLASTNSVDGLKRLGYQRMNGALGATSSIPLIVIGSNSPSKTLTVDFVNTVPRVRFSTGESPVSLYRSLLEKNSGISKFAEFGDLQKLTSPLPPDYSPTITAQDRSLEVDIFLVAIALSSDLVPLVSVPVALGTIQQISVVP